MYSFGYKLDWMKQCWQFFVVLLAMISFFKWGEKELFVNKQFKSDYQKLFNLCDD